MNEESKKFFNFLKEINSEQINYVIFRGFLTLPEKPDTDIDLTVAESQFNKMTEIALKYFVKKPELCDFLNYGTGEWCEMLYHPFFTSHKSHPYLPGRGFFRVDTYNSFYFRSPYNNFNTFWTVPKKFNDLVLDTKIKVDMENTYFYIPNRECEIILLLLRQLDKKPSRAGKWQPKHISRINSIWQEVDKDVFINSLSLVLANSEKIYDNFNNKEFSIAVKNMLK